MKRIDQKDTDDVSGGYEYPVRLPTDTPCFPPFPEYPQNPSGPITVPEPVYSDPVK